MSDENEINESLEPKEAIREALKTNPGQRASELQGIAGASLPAIKMLELGDEIDMKKDDGAGEVKRN